MTEYVVLGVQAYSIPDEKTGERVEGISIYYLDLAEGYTFDKTDPKEAVGGFLPGKLTATLNDLNYFSTLPGIYDIETKMKRTSKGSVAKFVDATLKAPMNFESAMDQKLLSDSKINPSLPESSTGNKESGKSMNGSSKDLIKHTKS